MFGVGRGKSGGTIVRDALGQATGEMSRDNVSK